MAGERCDQVGVFDLPIDVADEGSAGKVAAGYFVQRVLDLLACDRVQFRYQAGDAGYFESSLDVVIVVLFTDEGQQVVPGAILVLLHYLQGYGIERDNHRPAAEMQRLCGDSAE